MIIHTVTCSAFVPAYNAYEQFTKFIIRPRRLTEKGCERILNSGRANKLSVTSVSYSVYCK